MIYRIWALTLIFKIFASYWFPFLADEAYYWVWSKNLSLSYFDHPPMVAWLLSLGGVFESWGHAVRWPIVILGHCSILIWVAIMRRWMNEKDLFLFFLMLTLSFVTGFGTAIATPDAPLMFFWPLSIYALLRALETKSVKWYLAVGAACGLGFCSKYHMALFLPIVVIWLTVERRWREVKLTYLPFTFLVFALMASPVFIWNYQHDFASFLFQLNHGFAQHKESWVLDYVGSQIGLIFPTVFFFSILATTKYKSLGNARWLVYFAWFVPLLFLYSSTKGRVEPNWTGIALPSIFALALLTNYNRKWIKATLWIWGLAVIIALTEVHFKWMPIADNRLKTYEYNAFDDFLTYPEKYKPFYASSYQMASMLYYKTKTPVYKLSGTHRIDQFDYIPKSKPSPDTKSLYVLFGVWNNIPDYIKEYTPEQVLPDQHELRLMRYTKE